ncbi:MAG: PSK operon transcription factor [Boseongicola sp. SB0662_bin_57]|nr:PSK operon transcription factor [Boseongicola sp. SB0662_bin_57]
MSLNIKNKETCSLATELASLTGESKTAAITVALRERLEHVRRLRGMKTRTQELRAIAERCARLMGPASAAIEHDELLYDDLGLPK